VMVVGFIISFPFVSSEKRFDHSLDSKVFSFANPYCNGHATPENKVTSL